MLQLIALAGGSAAGSHQVNISKIPGLRKSVKISDGSCHFLYQYDDHFLQLHIQGSQPSKSVHLLTDVLVASDVLRPRLYTLEALNCLCHRREVPSRLRFTVPNSDRLRFVLRALDGSLAGASYREIAVVLIGADRVQANWRDDNDHLKNRIRRAVQRGRILMNKGYLRLLAEHWSFKEV